jgi:hypothetical protein
MYDLHDPFLGDALHTPSLARCKGEGEGVGSNCKRSRSGGRANCRKPVLKVAGAQISIAWVSNPIDAACN